MLKYMEKYNNTTSVLSVSAKMGKINNCSEIAKFMNKIGIASSIIENDSVVCNSKNPNNCRLEKGCDIRLNGLKPELIKSKVWEPLRQEFKFICAHLNIHGQYKGCIHDFKDTCNLQENLNRYNNVYANKKR